MSEHFSGETFGYIDLGRWLDDEVRQLFLNNAEARTDDRKRQTLLADASNVILSSIGGEALLQLLMEDYRLYLNSVGNLEYAPVYMPLLYRTPDDTTRKYTLIEYIRVTLRPWVLEQVTALWNYYERTA